MLLLGRKNAREKVATLLLDMRRRLRADPAGVIELPLSRQQIAAVLGLTRETVSRQRGELKRMGVIAMAGRRGGGWWDEGRRGGRGGGRTAGRGEECGTGAVKEGEESTKKNKKREIGE